MWELATRNERTRKRWIRKRSTKAEKKVLRNYKSSDTVYTWRRRIFTERTSIRKNPKI